MTDIRSHTESIVVAVPPDELYDLISDVTRTGEWSPSCRECRWADGATEAAVGARFHGRNEGQGRSWDTVSEVVAADRGREFTWVVGEGYVRWSYALDATDGGTRLTESWDFLPAGIEMFHAKYGDKAERAIGYRVEAALQGIPATLAAIKRIAEN